MDPLIKRPAEDSIWEGEQETELISDKVDKADEHDEAYEANETNETDKDDESNEDDETDKDVAAVSLSPKLSPGPSTVAHQIDKPNIWTDKMWREKQQLYPWLAYCVKMENLAGWHVISVRLLKV